MKSLTSATEADQLADLYRMTRNGKARDVRIKSGLSLAMVGRSVGCDASVISRWERGQRRAHGPTAVAYLELLRRLARAQEMP